MNQFLTRLAKFASPCRRRMPIAVLIAASVPIWLCPTPQAQTAPSLEGSWTGTLGTAPNQLHVVLNIKSGGGKFSGVLDSVDQHAQIPMDNITLSGDAVRFECPMVGGIYQGKLSQDSKSMTGTWTQTGVPAQPLNFTWQSAAVAEPESESLPPNPAKAPIALADLQPALDELFAPAIAHGPLAKPTGHGIVIGVYDHGRRKIFAYGSAQPDSIFEIGSITKTFTGLVLAQMVEQKKVSLDDPVRNYLPPGTVVKPDGREITLLDLATQHSGLPRMPTNFRPANNSDPYADYHAAQLYEFLAKQGVARPETTQFLYSNLGFGLLGQALANRAGVSYAQLVQTEVLGPLHMNDTGIAVPAGQQSRLIQGYADDDKPQGRWNLDVFAGAGGLVSTASDMLIYLEAQLHPEKLPANAPAGSPSATLPEALALDHQLRDSAPGNFKIALAWLCADEKGNHLCFHDGGTSGYISFASFDPDHDRAIVVLYNHQDSSSVPITEHVASDVAALLSGKPTYPLAK